MSDPDRQQHLIDQLQVIVMRAQRVDATLKQQQQDAAALIEATRRAVEIVRQQQPAEGGDR